MGFLDSCARLHLDRTGRFGSYFYLGLAGNAVALAVVLACGWWAGVPAIQLGIAALTPMVAFLMAVKVSQIVFGYERIVLYEKFAAALAGTALVLHLAGKPVLPGLDLVALGVGTFLIFGRLGCLRVGCCHGRPHRFGIIYGAEHARAGFTPYYVGVRLFPVQLLESLLTFVLVVACIVIYTRPHLPGDILGAYLLGYAVVRFGLELARGDDDRPYFLGASEAQWIAVLSAAAIALAAVRAGHQYQEVAIGVAASLVGTVTALAIAEHVLRWRPWGWRHVARIRELADVVARLQRERVGGVQVRELPAGVRLSYSAADDHYAVSRTTGLLDERAAAAIAARLAQVAGTARFEIQPGRTAGLFHLTPRDHPPGRNR